ncbi:outer membrane biosynthesis protein TonB [Sphingomonas sp. UYAg733]
MKTFFARQTHIIVLPLILVAGSAQAQNSQAPRPTPTLIPGLEGFRLPGDRSPLAPPPQATPTPTPRAIQTPRAAPPPVTRTVPTPRPTATQTPRATQAALPTARPAIVPPRATPPSATPPSARPTPQIVPAPIAPSTPLAIPTGAAPVAAVPLSQNSPSPVETSTPTPAISAYAEPPRSNVRWFILGGVGLLLLAGLGWLALSFLRGRQAEPEAQEIEMDALVDDGELAHAFPPTAAPEPRPQSRPEIKPEPQFKPEPPVAEPVVPSPEGAISGETPAPPEAAVPPPAFLRPAPATPASVAIGPRARIELTLRPIRAGTNLTSAAVDYEIDVRNSGEAAARGIRLDIRLLSASADQDAILEGLFAAPIDKPPVAPFDLEPGANVSLGGMAMLPDDAISVLTVQGKTFYVPVMAINALYHWAPGEAHGGSGQTATAFVIGIDRGPDAKMAPFRLDTGPRMREGVGQRPHNLTIER